MNGQEVARLMDDLHRNYRQLAELKYRVQRGRRTVAAGNAAREKLVAESVAKANEKKNLQLVASQREKEAETAAQELARRREQLDLSKSSREYESIKLQIETCEHKNDELADAALEAMTAAEEFESEIDRVAKELKEAENRLVELRAKVAAEEPKLLAEIERATAMLRETEKRIPRDFAGLYARVVKEFDGEDAFAPLTERVYCGSCNIQLPLEEIVKVCGGSPVCCPSCGRLLYMPEGYSLDLNK